MTSLDVQQPKTQRYSIDSDIKLKKAASPHNSGSGRCECTLVFGSLLKKFLIDNQNSYYSVNC